MLVLRTQPLGEGEEESPFLRGCGWVDVGYIGMRGPIGP